MSRAPKMKMSPPPGSQTPTCSAARSSTRSAARHSPLPRPRAVSTPTMSATSLLKRGSGTCKTPRLNAKAFEKFIVDEIRANILTESNIRNLVKLLDEEMDRVVSEQRERLETIEEELEEVKRRLGRIWQVIETTDIEMADASERIKEHRDRKENLETAAEEARTLLSDRRQFLNSADTIATFAEDMSEFLKVSELTQTRAFIHSFVKEIEVKPLQGRHRLLHTHAGGLSHRSSGRRRGRPNGRTVRTVAWVVRPRQRHPASR